jgi:hypothetical protein
MKFNIGDHLQEIDSHHHGIVIKYDEQNLKSGLSQRGQTWYLLENDELNLVNHWVPESKLELHKQPLREQKLKELGI